MSQRRLAAITGASVAAVSFGLGFTQPALAAAPALTLVNDISFSELKVNSRIADAVFKWTPPAGTRVIDASAIRK